MAIWSNSTKTLKGNALDQKLLSRSLPLKLKIAKSGAGKVNPTQLAMQTALSDEKQTLEMKDAYLNDDGTAIVPVMLSNIGLTQSYNLFQVGVYAEDPDEGDILYFISQTELASGEVIPSEEEPAGYSIDWNFTISISNASSIEVTINEAGKLTVEQGDIRYAQKVSPVFEGIPKAPTADKGTQTNQIATTKFVSDALADFTGGGIVVSDIQPDETDVLWIDTANNGIAKYYDGAEWVAISSSAIWG